MTDKTSDTAPEPALDSFSDEAEDAAAFRGGFVRPGPELEEDSPDELPSDSVEDGVALHIVQPHDPGTILVAVAEPADMPGDPPPPCGSEAPGTGQAAKMGAGGESVPECDEFLPHYGELTEVAAVRLSGLGPALFFRTRGIPCAPDDNVIVEMEEGHAFGKVSSIMRAVHAHLDDGGGEGQPLRSLVRKATDKDIAVAENNGEFAAESLAYCRGCIEERNLDMKLVDVLVLHDRGKMIFYFTAPARIDFRELVKDLVRRYRTRIELRQIGVRHETQMVGALGNCGMVCCCRRYLRNFAPVAIKMAKEQNVFLNPVKISGICGRLLCCLAYEQEHYDEFYRSCPKLGKKYHTDAGIVRVLRGSLFRESVTVLLETGEEAEYSLADWAALNPFRPSAQQQQPPRKQDQSGGENRRKGGGRNAVWAGQPEPSLGSPQDSHEPRRKEPHRREPRHEVPASVDAEAPWPAMTVAEEEAVVMERPDGIVAQRTRSVAAIFPEDAEADELFVIDGDDEEDGAGGSIFGLSPHRETPPADKTPHANGDARRKRPHRRRKPRPVS